MSSLHLYKYKGKIKARNQHVDIVPSLHFQRPCVRASLDFGPDNLVEYLELLLWTSTGVVLVEPRDDDERWDDTPVEDEYLDGTPAEDDLDDEEEL